MKETKQGICENCRDEYDTPPEVTLYKFGNQWVCGDCANQWEHEKEEHLSAYGED